MQFIIGLLIIGFILWLVITFWWLIVAALALFVLAWLTIFILKQKYFLGSDFREHKAQVEELIEEHNQIAAYTEELRESESFTIGISDTGRYAHLATSTNLSVHNYRRDRNVANLGEPNVHNCSLQVVRNAEADPIKYVAKYFEIPVNEQGMCRVEAFGENLSRLEDAIENLKGREQEITSSMNPPWYIQGFYLKEFYKEVGVHLPPIEIPYPVYSFQYVSAGGNSAQQTDIQFNSETVDALTEWMADRIKFRNSVAGQRALMTKSLRNQIKVRDNHTCQSCGLSVQDEPNLLLEIDHIHPLSRGGLSTIDNLQTLCWRCNRSKGAKILD